MVLLETITMTRQKTTLRFAQITLVLCGVLLLTSSFTGRQKSHNSETNSAKQHVLRDNFSSIEDSRSNDQVDIAITDNEEVTNIRKTKCHIAFWRALHAGE